MSGRRLDVRAILADETQRRELMVRTQAREGVTTTREQAEAAYGKACALCGGRKADPDEDKFCAGCEKKVRE